MRVLADTGEDIENFTPVGFGILHSVGREQWEIVRAGDVDQVTISTFFAANEVTLDFDVNIFAPENCAVFLYCVPAVIQSGAKRRRGTPMR